jgi:hypothetical protein
MANAKEPTKQLPAQGDQRPETVSNEEADRVRGGRGAVSDLKVTKTVDKADPGMAHP